MKITKVQQQRIEDIIREEMKSLKEGWRSADASTRSSRLNERKLFEADSQLEQDLSKDAVFSAMEQVGMDEGQSCLIAYEQELLKHLTSVLQSHGLLASGGGSARLAEILEENGEAEMIDAQMECVSDISQALDNYSKVVVQLILGSFSGAE